MRPAACLIILFFLSLDLAAQQRDPEWPCIQVLVPEIAIGVYWPRAIDEALLGTWEADESLSALAQKLSDLDDFTDTERRLIADFVESVPADSRAETLDKLADSIVTLTNQRRRHYIEGIKRYTRQQISIAEQIESRLNQLAELEAGSGAESLAGKADIEETLRWHERVYDQRERLIGTLCERPVKLEENLSRVLRELAQYLP